MLNYLWGFMILIGIVYGTLNGRIAEITNAALESSKEAVTLCITMTGVMAFWVGLMKIAEKSGLIQSMTNKMSPLIRFLFPNIPKEHDANKHIATNIIANILGLGWAATPAGLKAMESLSTLNKKSEVASKEMCTFLIVNISSLQLIPVNIIAYRCQYGSVNPTLIVGPAIIATSLSTIVGITFAKVMEKLAK
ncbi:nucleoside recognition domain-containing protein [Anaerosacchariphilus polymeriproducens]|uniref:Nucleoside recognition protein n=1 Tax=Anaerosacchariphilus polymeriproducens TaxID=1812858 RepID=A0A371ATD7_9FIRM|nr:nucleoside recognition domain-containing protein [Anaerosacchariphilus polymeriproducens]RDU22837.1 nucleoside recognition protein [Anaerosacchariphilus polymeriproducens]